MNKKYDVKLSRRESLKWIGAISASVALPGGAFANLVTSEEAVAGHWPELNLKPIDAKGYGKDPNLLLPPKSPWPKTLTQAQLDLIAVLADIIVPREGSVPSASEVGVPDVIDEWVSAPYDRQQEDRLIILSSLVWLDDESKLRYKKRFVQASSIQQIAIIDDVAYQTDDLAAEFIKIAAAFDRFRNLVLAAFFCSPEGTKDLGYQGNVPIMGDYPGPTAEAMEHLNSVLKKLNLSLP